MLTERTLTVSNLKHLREENKHNRTSLIRKAQATANALRELALHLDEIANRGDVERLADNLTFIGLPDFITLRREAAVVVEATRVLDLIEKTP